MGINNIIQKFNDDRDRESMPVYLTEDERLLHIGRLTTMKARMEALIYGRRVVSYTRNRSMRFFEPVFMGHHAVDGSIERVYVQPFTYGLGRRLQSKSFRLDVAVPHEDIDPRLMMESFSETNCNPIDSLTLEAADFDGHPTQADMEEISEFSELLDDVIVCAASEEAAKFTLRLDSFLKD